MVAHILDYRNLKAAVELSKTKEGREYLMSQPILLQLLLEMARAQTGMPSFPEHLVMEYAGGKEPDKAGTFEDERS